MGVISFIRSPEKNRITDDLEKQFGINKLPYLLFRVGREKIRGYSGHLSKEEIAKLARIARVEIIGIYLIKKEQDFRLSLDAIHLLKDQVSKSIIDLNDEQFHKWIRGHDLEVKDAQLGTIVIRYNGDFVGCGKSNGQKIFNYVPKDRRLRN